MTYKPGSTVPATGIYWCSVCKTPGEFTVGREFPECPNMCSRGRWEEVKIEPESNPARG
jgi:hypothetical protein